MLEFLKRFGLGIFYTVVSPFLAFFFILWFLYTLIVFFKEIIVGIVSFFKGKNFFPVIKEDQEAKIILSTLDDKNKINENPIQQTSQTTNQTININLAPGMNPTDVLSELNKAATSINKDQISVEKPAEIDVQNNKQIELDTTNNNNNNINGGNQ